MGNGCDPFWVSHAWAVRTTKCNSLKVFCTHNRPSSATASVTFFITNRRKANASFPTKANRSDAKAVILEFSMDSIFSVLSAFATEECCIMECDCMLGNEQVNRSARFLRNHDSVETTAF